MGYELYVFLNCIGIIFDEVIDASYLELEGLTSTYDFIWDRLIDELEAIFQAKPNLFFDFLGLKHCEGVFHDFIEGIDNRILAPIRVQVILDHFILKILIYSSLSTIFPINSKILHVAPHNKLLHPIQDILQNIYKLLIQLLILWALEDIIFQV